VASGEGGGGAGGAEHIDDDIEIEGGTHSLAPNASCPLSAKPVPTLFGLGRRVVCLQCGQQFAKMRAVMACTCCGHSNKPVIWPPFFRRYWKSRTLSKIPKGAPSCLAAAGTAAVRCATLCPVPLVPPAPLSTLLCAVPPATCRHAHH
jgi:hypothetical protein